MRTKPLRARIRAVGLIVACGVLAGARFPGPAVHQRRMPGGQQWTTGNLDVFIRPSYCYDDDEAHCRHYGRLYTWQAAQEGCRTLGDGWRLPAEGDWRRLAKFYGGVFDDSSDAGKGAYAALLGGGISAFDAVLGGNRAADGRYERLEAHGFYWTASESEPGKAWFYNFGKGSQALYRQREGDERMAVSVRCVRD